MLYIDFEMGPKFEPLNKIQTKNKMSILLHFLRSLCSESLIFSIFKSLAKHKINILQNKEKCHAWRP